MGESASQILTGQVERMVFRNESNSWTVMELAAADMLHKVVGELPVVNAGDMVKLTGQWVEHPSFGVQFRADVCEVVPPAGSDAILRYLSSGVIKGIGQATAIRIVEKFGDDTLSILENEPHRLAELKGISADKANKIGEAYAAQFGLREVMITFAEYGLTPAEAARCWKKWSSTTISRIQTNPYVLCSTGLYIGFERADDICLRMGRPADSPERLEAGILYVLRHNLGNGHTCLPAVKLIQTVVSLLGATAEKVTDALEDATRAFTLREMEVDGMRMIFLNHMYRAEKFIAARMASMGEAPVRTQSDMTKMIDDAEQRLGISYAEMQREAIAMAVQRGVLILTGGPGTGKTTTLDAIIALLEGMGEDVAIAAPTGRAAKRISELTCREAKTLHRLLEVQWDDEDTQVFARDEKNPLDADAVVVDELSMVDVTLFESLLRALRPGCRLIMVGDVDQLPPVGPGSVLHSLINSGKIPMVQLNEVFRQALESHIVTSAHCIVAGEIPEMNWREGDFFFLPQNSEQDVVKTVLELCSTRLPPRYGVTVYDGLQVLCPGRKGELGVNNLNQCLQERFNPAADGKREITVEGRLFRAGDKVMQVKNNYDIGWTREDSSGGEVGQGIFNGDIGILEEIDAREGTLCVRYDERLAYYTRQDAKDLELAYSITIHKSQGSEFDAVVLPIYRTMPLLCYRNLLYTAVTRAKSLLIIVGSRRTVAEMVENNRRVKRYTGLEAMMNE